MLHGYTHINAHISTHSELGGARAHESNEKLHYFLMHLLIDQSRKGSAPPTPRPPLPSVNQSRNNLMIGASCPFLVPSAARSRRGLLWRRASGNLSLLLTPGFSLFRSGFQRNGVWAKKAKGAEKGLCGIDRILAIDSHVNREGLVWRIARPGGRKKNRASHPRVISFECSEHLFARKYFAQEFTNEINREREKIVVFRKMDSKDTVPLDYLLDLPLIVSRGFEPKLCVNQLDLHVLRNNAEEVWLLNRVIINWGVREG